MTKPTVLSVEDTPGIRRLIRMTLEFDGFEVVEAADGVHGLELARTTLPDLILLDVKMPGMDGFTVCKHLLSNAQLSSIPVVMLSGSDSEADIQAGLQAGAKAYLVKPFSPLHLLETVHTLIDARVKH